MAPTTPAQLEFDFDLITHDETQEFGSPIAFVSADIFEMHEKFKAHETVDKMDKAALREYLRFRLRMIQEELDEAQTALEEKNPEELVDALIDATVFATGTLDLFKVDFDDAWDAVLQANLAKEVGIKAERPNEFGFPDLIKPSGWTAPSHEGNHGLFGSMFNDED
jgi:predicted HAD superfamily Cof-like phosphohydrolase